MTAAPRTGTWSTVVLISFAAITVLPILGVVLLSLQPEHAQLSGFELPDRLHFENYARAFEVAHFASYLQSSLIVSIAVVAGTVVVSTLSGYAFGTMAELWRQIQSSEDYRDRTTLIISTDHGRGSGPEEWKDHGTGQKGSNNIWIAVIGPDTAPLGERRAVAPVTQSQIAATIAEFVGEDYRAFNRAAAPSLLEAMSKR